MKIEMLTLMAGPNGTFQPGQVVDLPAKAANALIKAGFAKKATAKRETATDPEAASKETATVE